MSVLSLWRRPKPYVDRHFVVTKRGVILRKTVVRLTWRKAVAAWLYVRSIRTMYHVWLAKRLWRM